MWPVEVKKGGGWLERLRGGGMARGRHEKI